MNPGNTTHVPRSARVGVPTPARLAAAVLALAVAAIHILDQGGFPGSKEPSYVGIGYYLLELLELACLLVAAAFIWPATPSVLAVWLAAAFVAAGPLLGYILSRGPGLPAYSDDRGNWTEPLGVISLVIETALLVLSLAAVIVAPA